MPAPWERPMNRLFQTNRLIGESSLYRNVGTPQIPNAAGQPSSDTVRISPLWLCAYSASKG